MTNVETSRGAVRGKNRGNVTVFRGIPYALPPVNELRFAAPEPSEPWRDILNATAPRPAAMQSRPQQANSAFGGMFGPGQLPVDEDCLYLNIWVPAGGEPNKPVMVWIHGGAFRMGTGASPMYEASRLATRGDVIVVTLNYRLGCFGFIHAPGEAASNAGLRDQIAALRWINDEIEAFGGDRGNITVFGESAGAKSVECLMASPDAKGLFCRTILQSTYDPDMHPASATSVTARLLDAAGVNDVARLRRMNAADLMAAQQRLQESMAAGGVGAGFLPVIDNDILPRDTIGAIAAGLGSSVPAIIGTNRDENRLFGAMMQQNAEMTWDDLKQRFLAQSPQVAEADAETLIGCYRRAREARGERAAPLDIWFALSTDRLFRIHSLRVAEALSARVATRNYLFNWPSPQFGGLLGACHGLELPFVFGNMDGPLGKLAGTGDDALRLSQAMQDDWIAFARHGEVGHWPLFDAAERLAVTFDVNVAVETSPQDEERTAYLDYIAP